MLEYVLFSEKVRELFISWLEDYEIEFQLAGEDGEFLILIDEDIDQNIEEKIEAQYDLLLDENAKVVDEEDDSPGNLHMVGIQYTDQNDQIGQIQIPPALANQIQQNMTAAELQAFVQLIADQVLNPTNKSLCQS